MLGICFASIAIGTFSLTLVSAIMSGFEHTTHKKLQGIHADLTMQAHNKSALNFKKIQKVLHDDFQDVISCTPFSYTNVIVQPLTHSDDISHLGVLTTINPVTDAQTRALATMILDPCSDLTSAVALNSILIGQSLARELNLKKGDSLRLLFVAEEPSLQHIDFDSAELSVGGFFSTGIEDFDASLMFCSEETHTKLFGLYNPTHIGLATTPSHSNNLKKALQERFHLEVVSWQELYPSLMSALILEKYAMMLILALITLVAGMNIIALLYMYIARKKTTIALLKAMGMAQKKIRLLFMSLGVSITLMAGITGLAAACLASWLLETYKLIPLPDVYFSSHVPAHLSGTTIGIVISIISLVSLATTWIATRSLHHTELAQTLKFE